VRALRSLLPLVVAVGGAALGCLGVAAALAGDGPVPGWLLRFFAAWCVATPYWWYLEYRLFRPAEAVARRDFDRRQGHSRMVWLGFVLAMAVPILVRGR
jgi:hypothetical protein